MENHDKFDKELKIYGKRVEELVKTRLQSFKMVNSW